MFSSPSTGTVNKIVIFATLPDTVSTNGFYEPAYAEKYNRLRDYYHAVSYGKLNLVTHLIRKQQPIELSCFHSQW